VRKLEGDEDVALDGLPTVGLARDFADDRQAEREAA
jgi:hypothetical protein